MAIAFARANPISRLKGQSAVASAAYRACEKLHDERHDKDHNYKAKSGHIDGGLILPDGVHFTREELWNAVETFEKRIDARLCKEILVALPKELSLEENIKLSKDIAKLVSRELKASGLEDQYCVDWNMHEPHKEAAMDEDGNFLLDENGKRIILNNDNIHLHILITERAWDFEKGTFKTKKDRDRNSKEWMAETKLKIGEVMNQRLREMGLPEVDFRSFEIRNEEAKQKTGKELDAPQEHKGPVKTNSDRKRRRRINRTKRELKTVQDELARINKNEKESAKAKNSNKPNVTSKHDFSSWPEKQPDKPGNNQSVEKKGSEVKKTSSAVKVAAAPAPAIQPERKTEMPVPRVQVPAAHVSSSSGGSANQHGPKVRCMLCGIIEIPECKECKFRKKENEISNDNDGYSMGR